MALLTFSSGKDTWANESFPTARNSDRKFPLLRDGAGAASQVFLHLPMQGLLGTTVVSAVLSAPVRPGWVDQQVTVRPIDQADWKIAQLTYSDRPSVGAATSTSAATGALADGARFEVDVTAMVQAIADGEPNRGFRLTTTATAADQRVYGFDSGEESWAITVETSERADVPSSLSPDGGVVAQAKPVLSYVYGDPAEDGQQTAHRFQVDPAADDVTPDFDTGVIASTAQFLDLAATAYAGLGSGASTQWRVGVTNGGGVWVWSDWAPFTYKVRPVVTITSPSGASLYDPTTTVEASSTLPLVAYKVRVLDAADTTRILYSSGEVDTTGSAVQHQIPFKNDAGNIIFSDDRAYTIEVSALDDDERVSTVGAPAWTTTTRTVTFDDDANPTIDYLSAEQVAASPLVRLTWSRSEAADGWIVRRDGKVYARLDHVGDNDDQGPVVASGTDPFAWEWYDRNPVAWTESTYTVEAVTNAGGGTTTSSGDGGIAATVYPEVEGTWLVPPFYDVPGVTGLGAVVLEGMPEASRQDRRTTHSPPGSPYLVDIVTSLGAFSGTFTGSFDAMTNEDQEDARANLNAIRLLPAQQVRLIYGTTNIPVMLRNVSVSTDAPAFLPHRHQHVVTFEWFQVAEFKAL